jgi:hypothetical protein
MSSREKERKLRSSSHKGIKSELLKIDKKEEQTKRILLIRLGV